jgi:hypothetical protein
LASNLSSFKLVHAEGVLRSVLCECADGKSMATDKSAVGIYLKRGDAESAVTALKDAGFSSSAISLLLPEKSESEAPITDNSTKAPEGGAFGAGSGAAVGGALGWLVGAGALVLPGIGPVIAAGPIVAVLAGIGIGGALGGFAGSLIGVGIPTDEAERYEGRLRKGGILVAAHCETSDEFKRAEGIMKVTGAEDTASSNEAASDRTTAA